MMKQFTLVNMLLGIGLIAVIAGWFGDRNRLLLNHRKDRLALSRIVKRIHNQYSYPIIAEIVLIAGDPISAYQELIDEANLSYLRSWEFKTIINRLKLMPNLSESLPSIYEFADDFHKLYNDGAMVELYTIDMNFSDNPGGRDMLYVYVQAGNILLVQRQFDRTDW